MCQCFCGSVHCGILYKLYRIPVMFTRLEFNLETMILYLFVFVTGNNKKQSDPIQTNLMDIPFDPHGKSEMLSFMRSQRGAPFLVQAGFVYRCERHNAQRTYWLCTKYKTVKCNGRLICQGNDIVKATLHNHERDIARMDRTVIEYYNMAGPNVEEFLSSYKK